MCMPKALFVVDDFGGGYAFTKDHQQFCFAGLRPSRAEVKRSETPLDALALAFNNRNKVLRERNGQQNRSQAFLAVLIGSAEW
jgi:hypothetical protein